MNTNTQYIKRAHPASPESQFESDPQANFVSVDKPTQQFVGRISTRARHGIIRDNLLDGISFLQEQDRLLAFAGEILDELRSLTGFESPETILRRQILLQGLADVVTARYRKVLLFGNGTESPLKVHVVQDGERKAIEIEQANLGQPGFQSILHCGATRSDPRFELAPELAASVTGEIINLRFRNHEQSLLLKEALALVDNRIARSAHSRSRLFADQSKLESGNPKNPLRKLRALGAQAATGFVQRLKFFRNNEPVWEEIPTPNCINSL